jgi:hypothetical protein
MNAQRWRDQLRRADEQLARIRKKLKDDPHSTRAEGWRIREAALERDRVNYLLALGERAEGSR